jgi:hypothetical protein
MKRAEATREALATRGLSLLIHEAVVDVWRANRARYEPDELFDDPFTLSMLSSRNLANRLFSAIATDAGWQEVSVMATRDFAATVIRVGDIEVRLVKAPHTSGRNPNFVGDFDWTDSESRLLAAARNHDAYRPPVRHTEMSPLFELEPSNASSAVLDCHDAFLVWGADLSSGLTAGWLGLPITTPDRWLAVVPMWWDESAPFTAKGSMKEGVDRSTSFENRPAPVPSIKLKPRRAEGKMQ